MDSGWQMAGFALDAAQLLLGIIAGVCCYFWIRPADKKLQRFQADLQKDIAKLQGDIQKDSAKIEGVQSALLDAEVRFRLENHEHLVQSCILVYRAFQKIESSAGIVRTVEPLLDLGTIKRTHPPSANLTAFADWISSQTPKEWKKDPVFDQVAKAELFVSPRIWQLFNLAKTLLFAVQLQVAELGLATKETLVEVDSVRKSILALFPDDKEYLDRFGTSTYATYLRRIRKELVAAIRDEIWQSPVDVSPLAEASLLAEQTFLDASSIPDKYSEFKNNRAMTGLSSTP